MKSIRFLLLVTAVFLSLTLSSAQAALHDRGSGLIYDDVLNLTWLQDANYAKTTGFDADGLMSRSGSFEWIKSLSYFDSIRNVSYQDWRLPSVDPLNGASFNTYYLPNGSVDWGYNISASGTIYSGSTASEMAFHYYNNLAGIAARDINNVVESNPGPKATELFINIQNGVYWGEVDGRSSAYWIFSFSDGMQSDSRIGEYYTWAVRDGDVAAVPEPDACGMLLVGLGLMGFMARRKKSLINLNAVTLMGASAPVFLSAKRRLSAKI